MLTVNHSKDLEKLGEMLQIPTPKDGHPSDIPLFTYTHTEKGVHLCPKAVLFRALSLHSDDLKTDCWAPMILHDSSMIPQ